MNYMNQYTSLFPVRKTDPDDACIPLAMQLWLPYTIGQIFTGKQEC